MNVISANNFNLIILLILSASIYNCLARDEEEEPTDFFDSESNTDWLSYAHSPVDLFFLASLEEDLFKIIKEYVANLDGEVQLFFKRYIADYEESSLRTYENEDESNVYRYHLIHQNPLLAYRMIWRFVTDFPRIEKIIYSNGDLEMIEKLGSLTEAKFIWPSEKDLNSSMLSLLNLHKVYNLNIKEFAEGNISGTNTNASLAAVHCYEIAQFAFRNNQQYNLAIEWLDVADAKRIKPNGHPILDYIEDEPIAKLLEDIIEAHDTTWIEELPHFWNLHYFYNKIDSRYPLITQSSVFQSTYTGKGDGKEQISPNDNTAFSTLCKGENLQSKKEKSKLYCWYESKIHPVFYINPHKMELYNQDPYIYQVYDFIGNEMINYLKEKAIPIMERAHVSYDEKDISSMAEENANKQKDNYSHSRTSMYAWLYNVMHNKVDLLSEKIGHFTGLSPSFGFRNPSTSLQVAAYATGGYFNVHVDSLATTVDFQNLIYANIGDRLATFMLYLNDVELGGHTAFTSVGVGVPPAKGSAVFWYDSKHNGEIDYRVWHGGCPVLLGEKWVANKWIHQYPNILKRKCTLNEHE